jgi:hypothetical protein
MKSISILFLLFFLAGLLRLHAQIENVTVETYYISDANDATDTTGGYLESRSVTYRIYVDLAPGSMLTKIYGDENHALKFSSTENFFNNKADGQTFAKDFSKVRLGENTVALDSWLTIGQATRNAAKTYFGVLKPQDDDGSFIGGIHNDGGSAAITAGLLNNNDPDAGIPLTTSDGLDTMTEIPSNWADYGILDSTGADSTIFGSLKPCHEFISYNAGLQNSGVSGVNPGSNQVLVAQLTTKGILTFELNVEIKDSTGAILKYVANDSAMVTGEILSRNLKYPFEQKCGCPDASYLEYLADRDCDAQDSCRTLIVFGCMDTLACNYNPGANFHLQSLCCYPGYCSDRDISVVCPSVNYRVHGTMKFNLFPNPATDHLTLQAPAGAEGVRYLIYNAMGKIVAEKNIAALSSPLDMEINITTLAKGIYVFRFEQNNSSSQEIFIKN